MRRARVSLRGVISCQQCAVPRSGSDSADLDTLVYHVPRLYERIKPDRRGGRSPAADSDGNSTDGSARDK